MALTMYQFTRLFLAKLANNSRIYLETEHGDVAAEIPFDYRERISKIMYERNGRRVEFSSLINLDEYYEDHFIWELSFAEEITKTADELKKEIVTDLIDECLYIPFFKKEMYDIIGEYSEDIVKQMSKFVKLLTSPKYSRAYREFMDNRKI